MFIREFIGVGGINGKESQRGLFSYFTVTPQWQLMASILEQRRATSLTLRILPIPSVILIRKRGMVSLLGELALLLLPLLVIVLLQ